MFDLKACVIPWPLGRKVSYYPKPHKATTLSGKVNTCTSWTHTKFYNAIREYLYKFNTSIRWVPLLVEHLYKMYTSLNGTHICVEYYFRINTSVIKKTLPERVQRVSRNPTWEGIQKPYQRGYPETLPERVSRRPTRDGIQKPYRGGIQKPYREAIHKTPPKRISRYPTKVGIHEPYQRGYHLGNMTYECSCNV